MDLYPPDYTTELGKLRALIPDVDQADFTDNGIPTYLFSDQHLNALLGLYDDAVSAGVRIKRAASNALTVLATSEALISKVIKTEDLQTDGAKLANALLLIAARYAREADQAEESVNDEGGFMIVDFQPQPPDSFGEGWRGFGCFCGGGVAGGGCGCGTAGGNHASGFGRWY